MAELNTLVHVFFGGIARLAALLTVPVVVFLASCGLFHTSSGAGMGEEVVDGKLAFIVKQVDTSATFGHTRAHGVYVIVSMAVRNVSAEAQFFDKAAQTLKGGAGREYSATLMDPPFLGEVVNNIGPGLQVNVKLAFDVPTAGGPTQIVLRESASSHGAPVNLEQRASPSPPGG